MNLYQKTAELQKAFKEQFGVDVKILIAVPACFDESLTHEQAVQIITDLADQATENVEQSIINCTSFSVHKLENRTGTIEINAFVDVD